MEVVLQTPCKCSICMATIAPGHLEAFPILRGQGSCPMVGFCPSCLLALKTGETEGFRLTMGAGFAATKTLAFA